jgi:genome maintenance exonuclease 1
MTTEQRIRGLPKYEPIRSHANGERSYSTPLGSCQSVTTILSATRDNSGLEDWRESVGHARADAICNLASFRGTRHHENVEQYLLDGTEPGFDFLNTPYWKSTRSFLDRVDKPLVMEGAVYHPLRYAGTFDCIAYLDDDGTQPSLLDWKTADKVRNAVKMYEYSIQVAAYVAAANYVYSAQGLNIQRALIVVAIPDEPPQIEELTPKQLSQYFKHFEARVKRFTRARG